MRVCHLFLEKGNVMKWTDLLQGEIEAAYGSTIGLIKLVEEDELGWKPPTGKNWMTTAQLLKHLTCACGACMKGFVTGDWGMPEEMSEEEMLPPAEKLPASDSVEQALAELEADRVVALEMTERAGEEELENRMVEAPWAPGLELPLGQHLHQMVGHLMQHKAQLFYYLKLMGKDVDTHTLYGME